MLTHKLKAKQKQKKTLTMLSINGCLLLLGINIASLASGQPMSLMAKSKECGPDETWCPAGCCPMGPNWFCCPDDMWPGCAPTASECPFVAKRVSLVKMAKAEPCPGGNLEACIDRCPADAALNQVIPALDFISLLKKKKTMRLPLRHVCATAWRTVERENLLCVIEINSYFHEFVTLGT